MPVPTCLRNANLASSELAHASTLPSSFYIDASLHQWELRELFSTSWQLLGLTSELQAKGDYVARNLPFAPVLAVRGVDELRGFYNVCRHRAGPVALGHGNCQLLRCRYHGWVYTLDGRLQHAPELGEIADFDPDQVRLEALQLCQADGLVFARARDVPGFRPEITRVMSEVASQVGEQALQCRYHSSASYEIGCNWKVYVDNYLEGYHIPQVHPALAQMLDYREYETRLYDGFSLQHSDIRDGSGAYQQGEAFYYYLFPNMMLNILPGRLQTNVVVPLAADRCRVDFHYYYDNIDEADFIAADQALGDDVQKEDVAICEHVQRGLQSGVYDAGRLSEAREAGVHHWQELYRRVCRETLAGV